MMLCAFCLASTANAAAELGGRLDPGSERNVFRSPRALAELPQPGIWTFDINGEPVGVVAVTTVNGTQVCGAHFGQLIPLVWSIWHDQGGPRRVRTGY